MTAIAKRSPGRQSTFTPEAAAEIAERVSKGEPLAQVCRSEHLPQLRTVYDWMEVDADFAAAIARARKSGFDQIALEALRIADEPCEFATTDGGQRRDAGFVAWQKMRIETRLKLLAKWDPKRYGDALKLTGDENNPIAVQRIERVIVKP